MTMIFFNIYIRTSPTQSLLMFTALNLYSCFPNSLFIYVFKFEVFYTFSIITRIFFFNKLGPPELTLYSCFPSSFCSFMYINIKHFTFFFYYNSFLPYSRTSRAQYLFIYFNVKCFIFFPYEKGFR